MTSGGGGQNINLATLWIPVVPETSKIGEKLSQAGEEGARKFEQSWRRQLESSNLFEGLIHGLNRSDLPQMFDPIINAVSGKQALLIGVVSGAVSAGINLVVSGVENMVETVEEGAKKAVEEVMHVGEEFEEIHKQLVTYTTASGEALENLEGIALQVYRGLDTDAKGMGETLGVLRQQFQGIADDDLKKLTSAVIELGDRFGKIDPRQLAAGMHQFGVANQDVTKSLGTLIENAREFGVSVQSVQEDLIAAGPIFSELGVNFNGAAEAMAKMEQAGLPASKVMVGLAHAAGEIGKGGGDDLKKYILDVNEALTDMMKKGQTAQAEEMMDKIFGSRNWPIIQKSLQDAVDAINGVGAAGKNVDLEQLKRDSQTVGDKWKELRHDMEGAFAPVAGGIEGMIGGQLDHFKKWFDENQPEIIQKVHDIGNSFINELPGIKQFAAEAVADLGMFFDFMKTAGSDVLGIMGGIVESMGFIFQNDDAKKFGDDMMNMADRMSKLDFTTLGRTLSDAINNGIKIDPEMLRDNLQEAAKRAFAGGKELKIEVTPTTEFPHGYYERPGDDGKPPTRMGMTAPQQSKEFVVQEWEKTHPGQKPPDNLGDATPPPDAPPPKNAPVPEAHHPWWNKDAAPFSGGLGAPNARRDFTPENRGEAGERTAEKHDAGQRYADAHNNQVPPGYQAWLDGKGPMPKELEQYYNDPDHPPTAAPDPNAPPLTRPSFPGETQPGQPGQQPAPANRPKFPGEGYSTETGGSGPVRLVDYTRPADPSPSGPDTVELASKYELFGSHEPGAAPGGIGAPHWPGMKSGGRGGKDTSLQAEERQDRLDSAQDSLEDATDSLAQARKRVTDAEKKRDDAAAAVDKDLAPDNAIRVQQEAALAKATEDLTEERHAEQRAEHGVTRATHSLNEAAQKEADGGSGGGGGGKKDANAEGLGKGLLSGMFEEMGFGDIFGKAPSQWGITKLLGGAAQWGLGVLNSMSGKGEEGGGAAGGEGAPGVGPAQESGVGPAQEVSPFGSTRGNLPGPGQSHDGGSGITGSIGPNLRPYDPNGDRGMVGPNYHGVPVPSTPLPHGMHVAGYGGDDGDSGGAAGLPDGGGGGGGSYYGGGTGGSGTSAPNIWHTPMVHGGGGGGGGGGVETAGAYRPTGSYGGVRPGAQLAGFRGGVPITRNADGTISSSNPMWEHLISRESGGRNVRQGITDANSGGNEAEGYFQITPQTWRSHGGAEFAPNPLAASAEDQAAVAARILQTNPSGSDWGAGLPGREDAGGLLAALGGDNLNSDDSGDPFHRPDQGGNYPMPSFASAGSGVGGTGLSGGAFSSGSGGGSNPAASARGVGGPAGLADPGNEPTMAQRWMRAIQSGAIGPNGELAPGTAAGSEQGLQTNTIRGRRILSALFPELQNIGGVRDDKLKWHPQGLALDLMIPGQKGLNDPTTPEGKALGDQINTFITQNSGALGSDYTMWQQQDHYNHVHGNFGASGYPQSPNQQYFVPPGLRPPGMERGGAIGLAEGGDLDTPGPHIPMDQTPGAISGRNTGQGLDNPWDRVGGKGIPDWWRKALDNADAIPGWMPPFNQMPGNDWLDPRFRGGMSPGGAGKPQPWEHFDQGGDPHGMGVSKQFGSGDSQPAMLKVGEHVLTAEDVAAMGGQAAVYKFRQGLHMDGGGGIGVGAGSMSAGDEYRLGLGKRVLGPPVLQPKAPAAPQPSSYGNKVLDYLGGTPDSHPGQTPVGAFSQVLSRMTMGVVPDFAHDANVFTNWGQHSGSDQAWAGVDAATTLIPFGGTLARGAARGARGLGEVGRGLGLLSDPIPEEFRVASGLGAASPHGFEPEYSGGSWKDADATGSSIGPPTAAQSSLSMDELYKSVRSPIYTYPRWEDETALGLPPMHSVPRVPDQSWAEQVWPFSRDTHPFNYDEINAIGHYTGGSMVNDLLRRAAVFDHPSMFEGFTDKPYWQKMIGSLDSAIDKSPRVPEDIVVNRAVSRKMFGGVDPMNAESLLGKDFTDHGYMSTSVSGVPPWGSDYNIEMQVPGGARGTYVSQRGSALSNFGAEERELLLGRGSTFTPTSVGDHEMGKVLRGYLSQPYDPPEMPYLPFEGGGGLGPDPVSGSVDAVKKAVQWLWRATNRPVPEAGPFEHFDIGGVPDGMGMSKEFGSGDSHPAMLKIGEHVLTAEDVQAMGGQTAVYKFRQMLHHYEDGGNDIPNISPLTNDHYHGNTPGPGGWSSGVSTGPNVYETPQQSFKEQTQSYAISGLGSVLAGFGADMDPRQWQGILHEPEWSGVQHQHQPVQSVQPINYNNSINISGNTIADPSGLQQQMQEAQNSRFYTVAGGLPMPSIGSP